MRSLILLAALASAPALAQTTYTVTTTADAGAGSLRQAILDANAHPGSDRVAFDIPGGGVRTIRPTSALPPVLDALAVDGLSQPGARCDAWPATLLVELDGRDACVDADGLRAEAPGVAVRGLVVGGFAGDGIAFERGATDGVVECSYVGTNAAGTAPNPNHTGISVRTHRVRIGGPEPGQRNLVSGNQANNVDVSGGLFANPVFDTVIQGNVIGPDVTGRTSISAETVFGIATLQGVRTRIGGPDHSPWTCDRACNLIAGATAYAINLNLNSDDSVVEGNFIGTTIDGTAALSAGSDSFGAPGVSVAASSDVRVGGPAPGAGNLISGNTDSGVFVYGRAVGTSVQGNRIGVARDGVTPLGNASFGVAISASRETVVGGDGPGEANVIAYNPSGGVAVGVIPLASTGDGSAPEVPTRNRISANAIVGNGGMGIDLADDGPTGNDSLDVDEGPNRRINRPDLDLDRLTTSPGAATVVGTFHGAPGATVRIEAFASATCDPVRFGPGERYLGAFDVTTDAGGDARYTRTLVADGLPGGQVLTATATDAEGDTSEFSQCLPFAADVLTVRTTAASGAGSLADALEAANGLAFRQTITFAIPASDLGCDSDGVCTIRLTDPSTFGFINGPVVIDGSTQPGASCGDGPATVKVELDGTGALRQAFTFAGISLGSTVRGLSLGGFTGPAIALVDDQAYGDEGGRHLIECNHLGVDARGTTARPNGTGIAVTSLRSRIGTPGRGNVISGNTGAGVSMNGGGSIKVSGAGMIEPDPAFVQSNRIGVARDGVTPLGNGASGMSLTNGASYVLVGGTGEGEGNTIAHNAADGIRVAQFTNNTRGTPTFNRFVGNRTFENGGLGINLCPPVPSGEACDGATPNDDTDIDRGPNGLQNTPEIVRATVAGGRLDVTYRGRTFPDGFSTDPVVVDVYLADVDGEEGMTYVGRDTYTRQDFDAGPDKSASFALTSPASPGQLVAATATGVDGTSEFAVDPATVPTEGDPSLPTAFALEAPRPNPARGQAVLRYALPAASSVRLEAFDLLGRRVAVLAEVEQAAGWHEARLEASRLGAGVYMVRMTAQGGAFQMAQRVTVVR